MKPINTSGFIAVYPAGQSSEGQIRAWVETMRRVGEQLGLRITGASLLPEGYGARRIWLHARQIK